VYHYFPNREAQVEAVAAWLEGQIVGPGEIPRDAGELPEMARRVYRAFGRNEELVRAQAQSGIARLVRRRRRQERLAAIDAAVHDLRAGEPQSRWAAALIKHLAGADAGLPLKDEFGLEAEEAGEAVAWAIEAMLAELQRAAAARSSRGDPS
jgi:hypothetical protein